MRGTSGLKHQDQHRWTFTRLGAEGTSVVTKTSPPGAWRRLQELRELSQVPSQAWTARCSRASPTPARASSTNARRQRTKGNMEHHSRRPQILNHLQTRNSIYLASVLLASVCSWSLMRLQRTTPILELPVSVSWSTRRRSAPPGRSETVSKVDMSHSCCVAATGAGRKARRRCCCERYWRTRD